jgi:RNA polymerase sigma factor (sigma-70 family)
MPSPALSAALGRLARAADPPADGRLVTRYARTGDADAFAELVRRLGPMVLGVCRRVTGDTHLADDAFQATFLVLVRRAADVRPAEAVRGWVYGVAVRVAREARAVSARRRAREAPVPILPDRAEEAPSPPDADALRALDEEVAGLPEHLRAAVVLCELDGESRRDAAARLGVPEGTLSSRLAKGRKLLADRLRKRGVTAAGLAVLAPVAVSARLSAAASALASGPAPAAVAVLAHGVVRAMVLHKFRAVPVALTLFAVAALAAVAAGSADPPRPAPVPARAAAADLPPASKAGTPAPPVGIVVGRDGPYWRFDADGKKLDEMHPPKGVRFGGRVAVSPDGVWVAMDAYKDEPPQPLVAGNEIKPFALKLVVRRVLDHPEAPKVIDLPGFTVEPVWDRSAGAKRLFVGTANGPDRVDYRHPWVTMPGGTLSVPTGVDARGLRMLDVHPDNGLFLSEQRDAEKKTAKLILSGRETRELTELKTPPGFIVARFSPDGKKVLFTDGDPARKDAHKWGRSHRPYVLDVETKARTPLADFPENGQGIGVTWSPDGKRVAYTWTQLHAELLAKDRISGDDARRETEGFLMVADADGRNAKTIATDKAAFSGNLTLGHVDWR